MTETRRTKQIELAVAECVARSFAGYRIAEMRESPDADLVHEDGHHVGLEVVSVVDERGPQTRRRIEEAAASIESAMHEHQLRGRVSVYFDVDAIMAGRSNRYREWLRTLPRLVLEYLRPRLAARGHADEEELKRAGITRVGSVEWEPSGSTSVGRGSRFWTLPGRTVIERCLAKKHARLSDYRVAGGEHFREHWLAIESLEAGTVEDGGFSVLRSTSYATKFDRVLLIIRGDGGRFARAEDVTPHACGEARSGGAQVGGRA